MNAISKAATHVGSAGELARRLGVTASSVSQWAASIRPLPYDRCAQIEHATQGAVTVEELRPDVRWVRVADPSWPHGDGRPLVDVAPVEALVSDEVDQ